MSASDITRHCTALSNKKQPVYSEIFMAKQREQVGSVQLAMEILDLFGRRQHELATTEIPCAMKLRMSTFAGLIYPSKSAAIPARVLKNRKLHLGFSLAEIAGVLLRQFSSNAFRMRK